MEVIDPITYKLVLSEKMIETYGVSCEFWYGIYQVFIMSGSITRGNNVVFDTIKINLNLN